MFDRAVITAVPAPTAVTSPEELTVATFVLLEVHVTSLLVAAAGRTVAVICDVSPTLRDVLAGDTKMLVTGVLAETHSAKYVVGVLGTRCVIGSPPEVNHPPKR